MKCYLPMIDIQPGFTFLAPTPGTYIKHLYIIVVLIDTDTALRVNITTEVDYSDTSCVLSVGDHPFIKQDSVILYEDTKIISVNKLIEGIKSEKLSPRKPLSREVLERIKEGAKDSLSLPPKYLNYFSTT